jgi:hypothetical protein
MFRKRVECLDEVELLMSTYTSIKAAAGHTAPPQLPHHTTPHHNIKHTRMHASETACMQAGTCAHTDTFNFKALNTDLTSSYTK